MTLSKRLRASPTSDIMTEAADFIDALKEHVKELAAEVTALEQIVAAQAAQIRAVLAERDAFRETLTVIANTKTRPSDEKAGALLASVINMAFVALAQEQGVSDD